MDGKSHLATGVVFAGMGLLVTDAPLQTSAIPLIVGGFSGLVPDLDHSNSTLTKRLSVPFKMLISLAISIATLYFSSQLYMTNNAIWIYWGVVILGVILLTLMFLLKPKLVLLITGIILVVVGLVLKEQFISLILFGVYVMIASHLKHRGLTHSLYFLIFWSLISFFAQRETGLSGIWLAGTLGYLSHLLTDDWFTKTKVKWLKPKEFKCLYKK
ncbi:metal-dependent hydrolase [Virgibacillus halodenitrificans]|uniref:metal-dependent hydrolase n=1 Tax=Virgibacillus halodenitrificans TaxID=1482 RepID=UPI000EF4ACD7|nr:metal-dependent hydrolase [Virgibacillus halodenitrificans]